MVQLHLQPTDLLEQRFPVHFSVALLAFTSVNEQISQLLDHLLAPVADLHWCTWNCDAS
jgi:hypothetical protein